MNCKYILILKGVKQIVQSDIKHRVGIVEMIGNGEKMISIEKMKRN